MLWGVWATVRQARAVQRPAPLGRSSAGSAVFAGEVRGLEARGENVTFVVGIGLDFFSSSLV